MILIGRNLSPFVRRTATALNHVGLDYDQKGLSTADDADEIRKYNPVGRVPTLILDDGEAIIDSGARRAVCTNACHAIDYSHTGST